MATALTDRIVLKVAEVDSADPCFDEAGLRLDAQKASLVDGLHVLDGVPRTEHGIAVTAPGEDFHLDGLFKGCSGRLFAEALGAQVAPALRLLHGLGQDLVGSGHGASVLKVEWTRGASLNLAKERFLELRKVLFHGLFGGALHAAVDGGVDFEAVGVEVVLGSVGLAVGLYPLFHKLADVFAQVGSKALVVATRGKLKGNGNRLQGVGGLFGEKSAAFHLIENGIAAL